MFNTVLRYAFPLAAALLLIAFYTGLPYLKTCRLPRSRPSHEGRPRLLADLLLILVISGCYAAAAFHALGDRVDPQSFAPMAGREAVLELEEAPASVMLYTGVGMGGYRIETSDDGNDYRLLASFEQDHVAVLKWQSLSFEAAGRFFRIVCDHGEPWLGELVFFTADGTRIPLLSSLPELADEQATAPASSAFHNSSYFDEIYHARTAWEHLHGVWPYEISHPPLGKEILGLGIRLFGMTPFGWRFMGTLFGVLMLPVMYLFLKKLFGGLAVPALGTVVLASDFMHFVQTRIATIDTYGVFFILLMYYFMYVWISEDRLWALALAGIAFGLGAASKWTALYAGAGLGLLWLLHWLRRFAAARHGAADGAKAVPSVFPAFLGNCAFCLVFFVAVPALIYYLAYLPYGTAQHLAPFTREYTAMVWNNQEYMFSYHSNIVATHPYSSRWYQWLLDIRPILYYLEYFPDGSRASICAFLNPALCWGGLLALFVLVYTALFRADRKAGFLLLGYLAQLLPWVFIERLTFAYHYFPCSVFLVLALGYVFALMRDNRRGWLAFAGSFAAGSLLLFVLFYPVLSGKPYVADTYATVPRLLQWLPTWPL